MFVNKEISTSYVYYRIGIMCGPVDLYVIILIKQRLKWFSEKNKRIDLDADLQFTERIDM